MRLANIAFNTPTKLQLGQSAVIQLLLSARKAIPELKDELTEVGEREGAQIRVANVMEARLTGVGFKIEAVGGSEQRAVNAAEVTEWLWEVEATKSGRQRLHLTLSALIYLGDEPRPFVLRTFNQELEVTVTWRRRISDFARGNWQWLWTTFLVPIVTAIWAWRRSRSHAGPAPLSTYALILQSGQPADPSIFRVGKSLVWAPEDEFTAHDGSRWRILAIVPFAEGKAFDATFVVEPLDRQIAR